MRVLVAYYSKSGVTERIGQVLAGFFEGKGHSVKLFRVEPVRKLKAYEYRKNGKDLQLLNPLLNVQQFDLVLVGSPVWNFSPAPIILSYLRQMRSVKGKRFVLFSTCMALPGTTIKRMGNVLSTMGATVVDSLTVRSVFELDKGKLQEVERFAERLLQKIGSS